MTGPPLPSGDAGDIPDNGAWSDDPPPEGDAAEPQGFTEDTLLGGRVRFRQAAAGYRAAIDPVLLAAAVPAAAGEHALDIGCGAGAAMLCLASRVEGVRIAGIERDRAQVRLAQHNAVANGFAQRIDAMIGDLTQPPLRLVAGAFDHVFLNPPYQAPGTGTPPPDPGRRAAHVAESASLDDWLSFALFMARPKGTVTVIFRADGLAALLKACAPAAGAQLGGLKVCPLWPGPADGQGPGAKPARRIIVQGRKGARGPLTLLPGLVLHGAGGAFTPEAEAVLREAQALSL